MASRSRWAQLDKDGEWEGMDSDDEQEPGEAGPIRRAILPPGAPSGLMWNYSGLERIVLMLGERFGFRIEMGSMSRSLAVRGGAALALPAGLALAGGLLGRHFAGRTGATIGGAVGGVIGVGVLTVTLRDVWDTIKSQVHELLDIIFDYLSGLGVQDYQAAIEYLTSMDGDHAQNLALIILQVVREVLGKNVLSTLPAA